MAEDIKRPLKVFLCHASSDKPAVRDLYKRLIAEGVDAWLDQEKLLPGQNWRVEIPRAVREADVVVICLSNNSITKEGYIQKEIRFALDSAEEKPEGTIFLIPARLEDCVVPEPLDAWQWVDLFEEHGFLRLLRSLKLRAARIGATIEPPAYENDGQEIDRRLDQLYTEGLAAFYTEDWDRACQRFQTILRERPNHKNAAEKLAEAERQRNLAKLYSQAMEAHKSENWLAVIQALEELLGKSKDYQDAVQLLSNARKQRRLWELYAEAKRLHTGQKWQAVIKVFDQIAGIEANYPDTEGLLPSAEKELAELRRMEELNTLYGQGVREMDDGQWYKARELLEKVHKAQVGFLETERLLRKVENEITKIEELKKRNIYMNTLYEQTHELVRSKNWHNALDKIKEIEKLDKHFVDKDGLFEKVRVELAREEAAVQQQNELAAVYTEAVRLLKEGKYQEALNKWQEVKAIDPKYPDRQSVQRIARKKLTESTKSLESKPHIVNLKYAVTVSSLVITLAVIIWYSSQVPHSSPISNNLATPSASTTPEPPVPSNMPLPLVYWHFNNNSDGWDAKFKGVSRPVHDSDCGCITFTTKDSNPYISSPSTEIFASSMSIITISMKVEGSKSKTGAIYFVTNKDNEFNEDKKRVFLRIEDELFHTYNVNMLGILGWQDVVTQLRIEPVNDRNAKITITYIWVHTP